MSEMKTSKNLLPFLNKTKNEINIFPVSSVPIPLSVLGNLFCYFIIWHAFCINYISDYL